MTKPEGTASDAAEAIPGARDREPPPRARGQACYLVVEAESGGRWRDHAYLPTAKAERAIRAARELRSEPGIEAVRLNVEFISSDGALARHPLFLAPGHGPAAAERSLLAGYSRSDWELFLGSWLEQTEPDDAEDAAAERAADWRAARKAERLLLRRKGGRATAAWAAAPLLLGALYLGFFTDVLALDFSAQARPPAFAAERTAAPAIERLPLPPAPAEQRREPPRPAAIPTRAKQELEALARPSRS
jgi:hypothetical protein